MTRKECEKTMIGLLQQIVNVYHMYNPDGVYLALSYMDDDGQNCVQVNNRYYDEIGADADNPINVSVFNGKYHSYGEEVTEVESVAN